MTEETFTSLLYELNEKIKDGSYNVFFTDMYGIDLKKAADALPYGMRPEEGKLFRHGVAGIASIEWGTTRDGHPEIPYRRRAIIRSTDRGGAVHFAYDKSLPGDIGVTERGFEQEVKKALSDIIASQ